MAGEGEPRRQDGAASARYAPDATMALGLVPAPEIPEKIAPELPDLLSRCVDG
jgi:hypothetical protein